MERIISHFNSMFDSFYFHHTVSESGRGTTLYGPEAHQQFELLYLVRGEIEYLIEGEKYLVRPGDVIFVSPNEIHSLQIGGTLPYERIVVLFDLQLIKNMLAACSMIIDDSVFTCPFRRRVIPRDSVRASGIGEIMYAVARADQSEKYKPLRFFSQILALIAEIDKIFSSESDFSFPPVSVDPVTKSAIDYINAHIGETLSLDDIASSLYVSKSTLCHKFSQHMNISINRYVAIKKIYHAAALIKNGMSAQDACFVVGYNHYTTFFHNYKQILGAPPSFRKRPEN